MMCDARREAMEMWKTAGGLHTFPQHYYNACGAFLD